MMVRGCLRPTLMSVEVVVGPHPPPPVASRKPPNNPRAAKPSWDVRTPGPLSLSRAPPSAGGRVAMGNRAKRTNTYRPRPVSSMYTTGWAALVDRCASTVAPAKAPTAPGPPRKSTVGQCTLRSFQWETPEKKVVPSSAKCTAAEAWAGARPVNSSSVVAVTPKAIPRAPSTSWAARPAMANSSSLLMPRAPVRQGSGPTARRAGARCPRLARRGAHRGLPATPPGPRHPTTLPRPRTAG